MSVYLNLKPCSWGHCKFCGYNNMASFTRPSPSELLALLHKERENAEKEKRYFKIFNGGSWFCDADIDISLRTSVYSFLHTFGVKGLRVENRVDRVLWDEVAEVLKSFDLTISWGLEVADDDILNWLGKGVTTQQVADTLETSFKLGASNLVYIMAGLPYTTSNKEFFDTVKWLYERRAHVQEIVALTYVPMKGSYFYEDLWKGGKFRVISKEDWATCRNYLRGCFKDSSTKVSFETYHWRYLHGKTYDELYKRGKNVV
jgi:radical SAM enzyme (TIGR01210 family)